MPELGEVYLLSDTAKKLVSSITSVVNRLAEEPAGANAKPWGKRYEDEELRNLNDALREDISKQGHNIRIVGVVNFPLGANIHSDTGTMVIPLRPSKLFLDKGQVLEIDYGFYTFTDSSPAKIRSLNPQDPSVDVIIIDLKSTPN